MSCKLSSLYNWYKKGDSTSSWSPVPAAGYKARGDRNFYVLIDALDVNERDQRSLKSFLRSKEWQYNSQGKMNEKVTVI